MSKTAFAYRFFAFAFVFGLALAAPHLTFADTTPSLAATQTVANLAPVNNQTDTTVTTQANLAAGTNDQTDVTTATQANVTEIKATRTLTVTGVPADAVTLTIGTCVVTFAAAASADSDCSNNNAAVNTTTNNSATTVAAALRALTGVSDTGHGALTVGGSGATATFTTTATEASATPITASLSAGTAITLTTVNTTGQIPVAQISTVTVGGTVETNDVYTINVPAGFVTYTVLPSDTTTANIASGIAAALMATSTYSAAAYTVAPSTNTVVLTAKVPGTGFVQTSGTTNRSAQAQINTVTIGGTIDTGDIFRANVPAGFVTYTVQSSDTSLANIATGLATAVTATSTYSAAAYTAAPSGNTVVFTAKVAGTGFTQTSATTNGPNVAQQVTFVPVAGNQNGVHSFTVTINGTPYTYTNNTAGGNSATVVSGLDALLASDPAASCTDDGVTITCVARTAGTAFTFSSSVNVESSGTSSGGGGGGGGGSSSSSSSSSSNSATVSSSATTASLQATLTGLQAQLATLLKLAAAKGVNVTTTQTTTLPAGASMSASFSRDLTLGSNGSDVEALQAWLNAHGFPVAMTGSGSAGSETTLFGALTQAALAKYQASVGITPAAGYFGPKTRAAIQ